MIVKFIKLHIHHFLSFNDATIDLTDRGYCLVSGINKNPKDAAKSNGAGKSTIANAISYALIGETISGLKSNLGNIYYDDGCYVELEFKVDNNTFKLLRSKEDATYGTNLKIIVNDEDKGGKGIRESQVILDELLPDLTRELIGSVILLGQGLPDKFTANSPSGRKEVLEHLSKSDFMIQDLKDRIESRSIELSNKLRETDDSILSLTAQKRVYNEQLTMENNKLEELSRETNLSYLLKDKQELLTNLTNMFNESNEKYNKLLEEETTLNSKLLEATNFKNERLYKLHSQFLEYNSELETMKASCTLKINNLEKEINEMKNIKDICPMCGQRIPNVIKPDTSSKEQELSVSKQNLELTLQDIQANKDEYDLAVQKVNDMFKEDSSKTQERLQEIAKLKSECLVSQLQQDINTVKTDIVKLEKDIQTHDEKVLECKNKIQEYTTKINAFNTQENEYLDGKNKLNQHVEVVNKFNTYIKRDFRGILLSNSIDYINMKAQEYASKIFNTDEIEFKLDGNNIDISFCKKDYDNLSGGEKQRVDLITQFAIRDMLSKHLNFSSNIIFLDEITDNLDADSCDKVINFITQELKDIESTFIISHHADLAIPCDSEIVIVKNEYGVSEVM